MQVAFIGPEPVALASGLEPRMRVVTDGALYLQDGEPIAVQTASGPESSTRRGAGQEGVEPRRG